MLEDEKGKNYFYRGEQGCDPSLFCAAELLPAANMVHQVMEKGLPLRWRQATGQVPTVSAQGGKGDTSWMVVPLTSSSRTYGWLGLSNKLAGYAFTAEEEEMVMALSKQVVLAYENILLAEELRQSEKQLHLTLSTAGIQSWSWEAGSDVLTWLFSNGEEVHRTQSWAEYMAKIHPADRRAVKQRLELAIASGQNFEVEYRIRQGGQDVLAAVEGAMFVGRMSRLLS